MSPTVAGVSCSTPIGADGGWWRRLGRRFDPGGSRRASCAGPASAPAAGAARKAPGPAVRPRAIRACTGLRARSSDRACPPGASRAWRCRGERGNRRSWSSSRGRRARALPLLLFLSQRSTRVGSLSAVRISHRALRWGARVESRSRVTRDVAAPTSLCREHDGGRDPTASATTTPSAVRSGLAVLAGEQLLGEVFCCLSSFDANAKLASTTSPWRGGKSRRRGTGAATGGIRGAERLDGFQELLLALGQGRQVLVAGVLQSLT